MSAMKPAFIVCLAGSVALNVTLLGLMVAGQASPAARQAPASAKPIASSAPTAPNIDEKTWSTLRSDDLPAMVSQLRASGFPPDLVRAIMAAHLRESTAARRKALDPDADSRPFWKNNTVDAKVMLALRQLDRELQKRLRELLGSDAESSELAMGFNPGRRLDGIASDKLPDVRRILREFDDARMDIYGVGGMLGVEQQKKLASLEKEQRATLAGILTPQELTEYEYRNSDTAQNVRYQLTAFNPSEEEFRAIFKLQAQFDEQFGRSYGMLPADEERRRSEAQKQLNEQIKAALGPVRGPDYERANDYYYRQTSQLVARLDLPADTTQKIWEIQREMQTKARDVYTPGTQADDRTAQLTAMSKETEAKISALLGPRGFEAYKQYGGSWMQMFKPRTTTTAPGGTLTLQPGR